MKITVRKNIFLDIAIALMISQYALRRVLTPVTEHPMTVLAIIVYGIFLLHLLSTGVQINQIIKSIAPVVIVGLLVSMTWLAFPERHAFYSNSLYNVWNLLFPTGYVYLMCISLHEKEPEDFYPAFKMAGYIIFAYCMLASTDVLADGVWTKETIYNGKLLTVDSNYNLDWGYWLYLSCVFFTGLYLREKKKLYPIMVLVGLIWNLLFGSRGPMLSYVLFIILVYILHSTNRRTKRGVIICIIVAIGTVLINYGVLQDWIIRIAESLNVHSRTIEKLKNGTITDDSNRFLIYYMLFSNAIEKPLFGLGIYGDRYFMNYIVQGGSAYSHDVFLEMFVSFGILGVLFMIGVVASLIISFMRIKDKDRLVILMICVGGCIPLLWSLTFWSHPMFWVLLTVLIDCRKYRLKRTVMQELNR